jgi:hypothetical protein
MPAPTALAAEMRPNLPGRVEQRRPNAMRFMEIDIGVGTTFGSWTGSDFLHAPVDRGGGHVIKQLKNTTLVAALEAAIPSRRQRASGQHHNAAN